MVGGQADVLVDVWMGKWCVDWICGMWMDGQRGG